MTERDRAVEGKGDWARSRARSQITLALALTLAIAACGSDKTTEPAKPDRTGKIIPPVQPEGVPTDRPKPDIALVTADLPDDSWVRPANVAASNWYESFSKNGVKSVTVAPFRSPDRAAVPYLFQADATDAAGKVVFHGIGLVSKDHMINGGGGPRLTAYFQEVGFPHTRIGVGHLAEIVYVTGAIKAAWLDPPSTAGWEQYAKPRPPLDHVTATLEYSGDTALLVLYRTGKADAKSLERLEVQFATDGTFTQKASRQAAGATTWEPFTP